MAYDYDVFIKEVEKLTQIDLSAYKQNQMKRRIDALITKHKISGYEEYIKTLKTDKEKFEEFLSQKSIVVTKASKKSEREVDLRPLIYKCDVDDDGAIFMQLCTGSAENLKPELVLETFFKYIGEEMSQFALDICRMEVYGIKTVKNENGNILREELIPLEKFGEEIL